MERQNLNISQHLWWTERDSVLIAYYDSSTDKFTSPANSTTKIHLLYIKRPDKFLIPGEGPEQDGYGSEDTYLGTTLNTSTQMSDANYLSQEAEIPEQFHEALVARVIANGYERKVETLPLSNHYMMKYESGVKKARAYSFRGRDGSKQTLKPMDF